MMLGLRLGLTSSLLLALPVAVLLSVGAIRKTFELGGLRDTVVWRLWVCAVLRVIHTMVGVWFITYVVVVDPRYDGLFVVLYMLMLAHWMVLKNECLLSYLETKLMHPSYQLGQDPMAADAFYGGAGAMAVVHVVGSVLALVVITRILMGRMQGMAAYDVALVLSAVFVVGTLFSQRFVDRVNAWSQQARR
jgi:hypothetical protein